MILSASRRTDIPAFYVPWLMERLKAGSVLVCNPVNGNRFTRLHFSPDTVDCIVFWSKNPAPLLKRLDELDRMGWRYYFQFTLNAYGNDLEPGLPPLEERIQTFRALSGRIGWNRVIWRYDPVVFNDIYTVGWHLDTFQSLAERLHGCFRSCTISFVDLYRKLSRACTTGLLREPEDREMELLCRGMARVGRERGFRVDACCEVENLSAYGIHPASCVDRALAEEVCGYPLGTGRARGQRERCGCAESFDIGGYDTCLHGCVYCYANASRERILRSAALHDPSSECLTGAPGKGSVVTEKRAVSGRVPEAEQLTLF